MSLLKQQSLLLVKLSFDFGYLIFENRLTLHFRKVSSLFFKLRIHFITQRKRIFLKKSILRVFRDVFGLMFVLRIKCVFWFIDFIIVVIVFRIIFQMFLIWNRKTVCTLKTAFIFLRVMERRVYKLGNRSWFSRNKMICIFAWLLIQRNPFGMMVSRRVGVRWVL